MDVILIAGAKIAFGMMLLILAWKSYFDERSCVGLIAGLASVCVSVSLTCVALIALYEFGLATTPRTSLGAAMKAFFMVPAIFAISAISIGVGGGFGAWLFERFLREKSASG